MRNIMLQIFSVSSCRRFNPPTPTPNPPLNLSNLLTLLELFLLPFPYRLFAVAKVKDCEQTSSSAKAKRQNPFCLMSVNNFRILNKEAERRRKLLVSSFVIIQKNNWKSFAKKKCSFIIFKSLLRLCEIKASELRCGRWQSWNLSQEC